MSNELEARLDELRNQAKAFAEAEADRVYIENFKKSKLAMLMKVAEKELGLTTVNAQEREARTHPEYLELLDGLKVATQTAEENKWLLQIAMRGSSLYQTQQATRRAEITAYGSKDS